MAYLGNVYKESGNYEKIKDLLEKSFKIHQQKFKEGHPKIARVSLDFGDVLGESTKTKSLLEQVHVVYKEAFSEDSVYTATV